MIFYWGSVHMCLSYYYCKCCNRAQREPESTSRRHWLDQSFQGSVESQSRERRGRKKVQQEWSAMCKCRFPGNKKINWPTWSRGSQSKGWGGNLGSEHAGQWLSVISALGTEEWWVSAVLVCWGLCSAEADKRWARCKPGLWDYGLVEETENITSLEVNKY